MALTKVKLIADGVIDVDHLAANHGITTDNIGEGTALYYTDARVSSYLTTNNYATEGYVTTAVSNLVDAAPSTLDTLNELAAALGDDPNFATTVTNSIATKLPLAGGTLTGGLHINTTSLPQLLIQNVDGGTNAERIAIELNAGDVFKIRSLNDNNTTRVDNIVTANILTGNVGIGTTSPSAKLEVNGTFKSAGIQDSADSLAIFINGNEEVGVGTTSPTQKLDVAGTIRSTANEGKLILNSTATNGKQYEFISIDTGNLGLYDGTAYRLWVNGNGNIGIRSVSPGSEISSNATVLQIDDSSVASLALNHSSSGKYEVAATGLGLDIRRNGSNYITVDTSGNVGIGTTSPSEKLDVVGQIKTSGSTTHALRIQDGGGGYAQIYATGGYYGMRLDTVTSSSNYYLMSLNNSLSPIFYVQADGRVGFGTGTPTARIDSTGGGYILQGGWGLFSSYTSDGLFNSNAQPNFLSTNGYNGSYSKFGTQGGLLLGYQDNGAGLYSPAYGFEVKSIDGRPVGGQVVKAIVMHDIDTDEQPFWVNNNGSAYFKNNVGIGTTSPSYGLHVASGVSGYSAGFDESVFIGEGGSTASNLRFANVTGAYNTFQQGSRIFQYFPDGNGTAEASIYFNRSNGTGGGVTSGAEISFHTTKNTYGPYGRETDAERMRITQTGNIKLSSTTTQSINFAYGGGNNKGGILIDYNAGEYRNYVGEGANTYFQSFYTNAYERMRITSNGFSRFTNNGSYQFINYNFHEFDNTEGGNEVALFAHKGTSNPYGIQVRFTGTAPNNTSNYFYNGVDTGATRYIVYSNGNVVNANNSYGAISDIKLKENIVDTSPKLDDLMQVQVRNFNYIGDDKKQLGVVAQELEEVFPSMIDESPDFEEQEVTDEEGNITTERVDLGTTTKSVKYSVFVPMLIKAMQEQQEIINDLKSEIDLLKAQLNG